ncbi:uncharacterized protein LOC128983918 [Macrosteles quadrilineatus]|uniref:uncharacterized protein LOC128983918 n=1 Tax=Macrosteles quadrilineatus TaxID=74068 RepID=UPI0023E227A9|nr:uncharacterized protein LOC128983918 [Macrosteles quadrilineatus]
MLSRVAAVATNDLYNMKWFLVWLFLPVALISCRAPPGSAKSNHYLYVRKELAACEDFNNSVVDIAQLVVEKRGKEELAFAGNITIQEDVDDLQFKLDVFVDKNENWEYLDSFEDSHLCEHLMDKDKVWTSFVKEMGLTGCPIKKNTFALKDSMIDISKFSLSAKNAGLFRGIGYLLQDGKKISCHFADVSVST